jgi:plasmid stabilization system protein ParE
MNYWLHPGAREDLREAAEFYRNNAGVALSQSLLAEFEHSVNLLLEHPRVGSKWRYGKRTCARLNSELASIRSEQHSGASARRANTLNSSKRELETAFRNEGC